MSEKALPDGMALRGATYWADFRCHGRRIRKSLSRNFKTARQLLIELRARTERGEFGLLDNDVPVAAVKDEYLKHCRQCRRGRTVGNYEQILGAMLPHFPPRVSLVTTSCLLAYREKQLAAGKAAGTINLQTTVLRAMLRWAVESRLIGSNPLAKVKALRDDVRKEGRALDRVEVDRLLAHSPQPWKDIWYAFLTTGLRSSELCSLTSADIDWENREVVIRPAVAKSHRARRIPIDTKLWTILVDRREAPGGAACLFLSTKAAPLTRQAVYHAFIRCCERADIEVSGGGPDPSEAQHVDVHSLRRTFATELITSGADPKTVMELLGHSTVEMTLKLYAKIHRGTKRDAIGRLSYGAGVVAPDHLIEFPASPAAGHKMVTTPQKDAQAGSA